MRVSTRLRPGRAEELAMHPTIKPVAMVADAIRDCSRRGETVLDCFGGSGTTLIAAETTGRRARLIEADPAYCDQTLRRFERVTGKQPCHGRNIRGGCRAARAPTIPPLRPSIGPRFSAGIGVDFGAVERHRPQLEQAHLARRFQHPHEQRFDLLEKAPPKCRYRIMVEMIVAAMKRNATESYCPLQLAR